MNLLRIALGRQILRRDAHCRPTRGLFERLEPRNLLAIDIFAAGATGEETLALQIDGQTVQSWANVGGDYDNRVFEQFTYNVDGIALDRIRVAFTNDGTSSGGEDKNLRVDRIVVDGATFQTESPDVLSTGTWTTDNGCGPGFKQSELLHCGGYFQFPAAGSNIRVFAAGATGEEELELRIDGLTVDTFSNIGGDYNGGQFVTFTHNATATVSASQIELAFVNDGNSSGGADRNVRVDGIEIDGQFFETESPNVLSTGTWSQENGCGPGFKQSELLHCFGSFFYGQAGSLLEVYAAGATGTETIEILIDGIVVSTIDNVGGDYDNGVFETYTYDSPTTLTADQVRISFIDNGTGPGGADKNVRIDAISIDAARYETEDNTVFSLGSWTAVDGCGAGFKQSEFLHCSGYFQFSSGPPANPGEVSLERNLYTVSELDGSAGVEIVRNQGTDGIATVDYRTFSGSAIEDEDFIPVSGRVIFFPGETVKVISIPMLDDPLDEGTEVFSFTIDNVQGGATLLVPRTALIRVIDDENPGDSGDGFSFSFPDFSVTTGLQLNGDSTTIAGELIVTDDLNDQLGSVYYDQAIAFDANTSFTSTMTLQLDGGLGTEGADGMALVFQNTIDGPLALGDIGGGLGFEGIGTANIAIELDTYQNTYDPDNNHVALLVNGDAQNPLVTAAAPLDLNSGAVLYVWIEYVGETNVLDVYLSDAPTQPATPLITQNIDLASVFGNQFYAGFSAATGGRTNEHKVLSWSVDSTTEPVPDPVTFTGESIVTGLAAPTAIDWSSDGQNMYIAQQGGAVLVYRNGQLLPTPTVDISSQVNGVRDRGLLDIAVHPDLTNHPYLYALYTYDPPEVSNHTGLAGPDGVGNRAGRLGRFTLDAATNFTTVVPGSEVILLGTNSTWDNFNAFANSTFDFTEPPAGILPNGDNLQDFLAADSESHTVGAVQFGPDGALYVTNGDGTSYNQVDPRTVRVQDIDNLSGKLLRIDPLTGAGLVDNPFFDGDPQSNRSKVYQYGFRNPFRFAIDSLTGQTYVGDVGWTQWEEINAGQPGGNFGWPYYEGGNQDSIPTSQYQDLPEAQAFYASGQPVVAALLGLNHAVDGINAIVMGDVYDGNVYPAQFQGDLIFNDLGQGIVRNISFNLDGSIASVDTFALNANIVVHMSTGPDGYLYFVDLDDGVVGRWVQAPPAQGATAGSVGAELATSGNDQSLSDSVESVALATVVDQTSGTGSGSAVAAQGSGHVSPSVSDAAARQLLLAVLGNHSPQQSQTTAMDVSPGNTTSREIHDTLFTLFGSQSALTSDWGLP